MNEGPISINLRIIAVRKLAVEAADSGLLAPDVSTKKGLGDRAMPADLLGSGLRRAEMAVLI
jgi:hypothetical protein